MRLATVEQSREIDQLSSKVYGLNSEILMEAAGALSTRELQQNFYPELTRGMTAIVCGPGNNGGDGLVLARHLHSAGFRDICVILVGSGKRLSPLFKMQLKRVELHGIRIINAQKEKKKLDIIKSATLIVDALFGIGAKGELKSEFASVITKMNAMKIPIASLDCPSGLDCNSGQILGIAVRAHTTFTFGLAKPGFFVGEGPQHVGKLRVLSIGFPYESLRGIATTHFVFLDRLARRYLPQRKDNTSKADYGRAVIMAGSPGMWGAGILASQAAYRMGAGYVVWATNDIPIKELANTPEVLTATFDDDAIWNTKKVDAYLIGPGAGVNDQTLQNLRRLKNLKAKKVVVDADALIVALKYNLFPFPKSWVVTPHSGELSKLIKMSRTDIEANRFAAALKASKALGCHVLLKGYRSILAYGERCMLINSGNAALAKAGSGDVLSGMIVSLMAQGLDTIQATATAAYLHGKIADEWVRMGNDKRSLNPSDLKEHMSKILSRASQGAIF
jgi:hydroxyethylthiazole kinase-like uncharacterized protein yjeF